MNSVKTAASSAAAGSSFSSVVPAAVSAGEGRGFGNWDTEEALPRVEEPKEQQQQQQQQPDQVRQQVSYEDGPAPMGHVLAPAEEAQP